MKSPVLENPFTPKRIASGPNDFFGREQESEHIERCLSLGHVAIHGAIGVGKSSLLSHMRLLMEGFACEHHSVSVVAIGNRDITTIDQAANLVLKRLLRLTDESKQKFKVNLCDFISYELEQTSKYPDENKYLTILERLIEKEATAQDEYVILAFDEADKCPKVLARLFRSLITLCDHEGIANVRFLVAGVSPYFRHMTDEDPGMAKYFDPVTLLPMSEPESTELLEAKLRTVVSDSKESTLPVSVHPEVVPSIVRLSGGHPHLLQLLGSHLIENENGDPDQSIDLRDLTKSIERICYRDRDSVYKAIIAELSLQQKMTPLMQLLSVAESKCPTVISEERALSVLEPESIQWFVEHDLLTISSQGYRLLDEFLRIRLLMDETDDRRTLEERLVKDGRYVLESQEYATAYEDAFPEMEDDLLDWEDRENSDEEE